MKELKKYVKELYNFYFNEKFYPTVKLTKSYQGKEILDLLNIKDDDTDTFVGYVSKKQNILMLLEFGLGIISQILLKGKATISTFNIELGQPLYDMLQSQLWDVIYVRNSIKVKLNPKHTEQDLINLIFSIRKDIYLTDDKMKQDIEEVLRMWVIQVYISNSKAYYENILSRVDLSKLHILEGSDFKTVYVDKSRRLVYKYNHRYFLQSELDVYINNKCRHSLNPVLAEFRDTINEQETEYVVTIAPLAKEYLGDYLLLSGVLVNFNFIDTENFDWYLEEEFEEINYSSFEFFEDNAFYLKSLKDNEEISETVAMRLLREFKYKILGYDVELTENQSSTLLDYILRIWIFQKHLNLTLHDMCKESNFGIVNNKIVCIDYGGNDVVDRTLLSGIINPLEFRIRKYLARKRKRKRN